MTTKGLKKALLIGINYIEDPNNRLNGCINDIKNIEKKLRKTNPECKEFVLLSDDSTNPGLKPTRKNIINGIHWLVNGLKAGESVFVHYSGHGGLTVDTSGDEEYDSCIYPICNKSIEIITDDELRTLLVDKIPLGSKCFAVFDCCHSGSALDLRYTFSAPAYGKIILSQNNYPKSTGSVIFLSGCQDNQTSADTVDNKNIPSGALTNALIQTWDKYGMKIKFKYLLWDIRESLKKNKYEQIPQLSCSNNISLSDEFVL